MKIFSPDKDTSNDENILSNIFKRFYFSSVLAIICSCLGQIVGNIVVGNTLGEDKLSVMSLVLPVYYIFATIGNMTGIGGSALCGKFIGKLKHDDCKKAYTVCCIFTLLVCALFSVIILLFLNPAVDLLGTPQSIKKEVRDYLYVMVLSGPFIAGIYIYFNMLRLDGKPIATTMTFIIMAGINVILDFALSFLGILGVAIAYSTGVISATFFGLLMTRNSQSLKFTKVSLKEFFRYTFEILKTGSPGATENASILFRSYILNQMIVAYVGAFTLSTFSVISSVNSFSMSITVGCAGSLVPIISIFASEKDNVSIRRVLKNALRTAGAVLLAFILILIVFSPQLASLFGVGSALNKTAKAIRIFAFSLPFALFANVAVYFFLANSKTVISNILTFLHSFVYPLIFALYLMNIMSVNGLWLSFAACEGATVLTVPILNYFARRKNPNLSPVLLLDSSYEKNGNAIDMSIKDDDISISKAVEKLGEFCDSNGIEPKKSMIITLSMDEMLHMASKYSTSKSNNHVISIRVLISPTVLVLRLRYEGAVFNPVSYYENNKKDA